MTSFAHHTTDNDRTTTLTHLLSSVYSCQFGRAHFPQRQTWSSSRRKPTKQGEEEHADEDDADAMLTARCKKRKGTRPTKRSLKITTYTTTVDPCTKVAGTAAGAWKPIAERRDPEPPGPRLFGTQERRAGLGQALGSRFVGSRVGSGVPFGMGGDTPSEPELRSTYLRAARPAACRDR